jgi:integrase/recombinase XerC
MKEPEVPNVSTGLVVLRTDPITLERPEAPDEIIRRRIEAALTRLAEGSARQYSAALRHFARWFSSWSIADRDRLGAFLPPEIIGAQIWWTIVGALFQAGPAVANEVGDRFATLGCAGLKPATVAQRLAALRWVFRLGEEAAIINWRLNVRPPRVKAYRDTRGPGLAALMTMLEVIDQSDALIARRDAVMICLLFVLGLRRGEAASLKVGDFDAKSRTLNVIGKGQTEPSPLSVPEPLANEIVRYLELRGNPAPAQPLIASHDPAAAVRGTGALTGNGLYRRVLHLARLAGLSYRVLPHGLRHSAITTALDETNGDVRSVMSFSRHAKAETVLRYDDNRRDVGGRIADRLSAIWSKSRASKEQAHKNAHSRALPLAAPKVTRDGQAHRGKDDDDTAE